MGLRKSKKKQAAAAAAKAEEASSSSSSDDDFIARRAAAARARRAKNTPEGGNLAPTNGARPRSLSTEKTVLGAPEATETKKGGKATVSDDEALGSMSSSEPKRAVKFKKKRSSKVSKPTITTTAADSSSQDSDIVEASPKATSDAALPSPSQKHLDVKTSKQKRSNSVSTGVSDSSSLLSATDSSAVSAMTGIESTFGRLFLEVIVLKGRDLIAKDRRGTSDPFAKLRLIKRDSSSEQIVDKTRVQKTKVVYKTLAPQWSEERFSLEVPGGLDSEALEHWSLLLEVFDHDRVGASEFMGRVVIPLHVLAAEQRIALQQKLAEEKSGDPQDILWRDHWYDLESNEKKVEVSGAIRLQVRLKELEVDKSATESSAKSLKRFRSRFPHLPSEVQVDAKNIFAARRYVFKGVPMQGTLYIANFYACFYVNTILSAVGTLATLGKKRKDIIKLADVVDIVRADSVLMIPDAIKIHMDDGSTYYFGGLFHRELAYEALRTNWKACLKSGRDIEAVTTSSPRVDRGLSKLSSDSAFDSVVAERVHCRVVQGAKGKRSVSVVLDANRTCAENMRLFIAAPLGIGAELIDEFELFHTKLGSSHLVRMRADKRVSAYSAVTASATADAPVKLHIIKPEKKKFKAGKIELPSLPFSSFAEKVGVADQKDPRPPDEVCLELVLQCVDFPMTEPLRAETLDEREDMISSLLDSVQQGFGVSDDAMEAARRRVFAHGGRGQGSSFIAASQLMDVRHRLRRLGWAVNWPQDADVQPGEPSPFYSRSQFADAKDFDRWRKLELAQILNQAEQLVFPSDGFYGRLVVNVVSATGLPAKDVTGTSDPYVVIMIEDQREKTKFKAKTLTPVWNQALEFGVTDPEGSISVEIFDHDYTSSDDYMTSVTLYIKDLRSIPDGLEQTFEVVDTDDKPSGSITLSFQFEFAHVDLIREIFDAQLNDVYHGTLLDSEKLIDHHSNYSRILKILLFESFSGVHLLARSSEWLLEEFGCRYGIHWPYRKLSYLDAVGMILQPQADELTSVEDALTSISRVEALGEVITTAELDLQHRSFEQLSALFESYCLDYKKLFPQNKPSGGVSAVCDSITILFGDAAENLIRKYVLMSTDATNARLEEEARVLRGSNPDVPSSAEMIQLCDGVEREILDAETYARAFPRSVDITRLVTCRLYRHIQKSVLLFCREAEFSMDVFQLYFRLSDLHELVAAKGSRGRSTVLDLTAALGESPLDDGVSPYELRLLRLPAHFAQFIYRWLKTTMHKLLEWSDTARLHDALKPMTEDIIHSTSVHDTFSGVSEALQFLRSLETQDPFMLVQFAEVVCRVAHVYSKRMADQIIATLPLLEKREARVGDKIHLHLASVPWSDDTAKEKPLHVGESVDLPAGKPSKSLDSKAVVVDPLTLKMEFLIAVNNIEDARAEMDRIVDALEEDLEARSRWPDQEALAINRQSFDACVKDGFAAVKAERDRLLDALVQRISHYVVFVMTGKLASAAKHYPTMQNLTAMSESPEATRLSPAARDHLRDLITYLDEQLTEMNDHLSPALFKLALRTTFANIGARLKGEIFPIVKPESTKSEKQPKVAARLMNKAEARALVAAFDSLKDYFHADGDGLEMEFMDQQVGFLDEALHLWDKPTRELLIKFRELSEMPAAAIDESDLCPGHILQMLSGRKKTDVLARSFLHEQQDAAYHEKQQKWRRQFLLEGEELLLEEYNVGCSNNGKTGTVYLTSSFVLFDARFSHGADDGHQIVIELLKIKSIRRTKKRLGMLDVITIAVDDGETYEFTSLMNREAMVDDIYEHAVRSGNRTIER